MGNNNQNLNTGSHCKTNLSKFIIFFIATNWQRKIKLKIINDRSLIQKISIIGLIVNFLLRDFWFTYFDSALLIYWIIMFFFIAGLLLFPKKKKENNK